MFEIRDGTPFSRRFDDIYFSRQHGLEESRHVFLRASNLPARWQGREKFVVGETGFGTGLNFLACWQMWQEDDRRSDTLHYLSIEKYPLNIQQLVRCHQFFPELGEMSTALQQVYPVAGSGVHRLWFDNHKVCLTLALMDVEDALRELECAVDCWFLDGFAPARNPGMWNQNIYRGLARSGSRGTTIATFTAAGSVRRGLQSAGFTIKKCAGYGTKRDMTTGVMECVPAIRTAYPWSRLRSSQRIREDKTVLIIGAGIGGAQIGWHLAKRGYRVQIIDRQAEPAMEASGNPLGVIAPRMSARPSLEERFSVDSYLYALKQVQQLGLGARYWSPCGVLHLAHNQRKLAQWRAIADRALNPQLVRPLHADDAARVAGIPLSCPALYFPSAGWVAPRALVAKLLAHHAITLKCQTTVNSIQQTATGWTARFDNGRSCSASIVVLACGSGLNGFDRYQFPVDLIGGQTTLAAAGGDSSKLKTVIQHDGYITPQRDGYHLLGATYQRHPDSVAPTEEADIANLEMQQRYLPDLVESLGRISSGPAAVRTATNNRFPLVGPVVESVASNVESNSAHDGAIPLTPGLFVLGALGSRGLTTAALCAELLSSIIEEEPLPVGKSLYRAMHPARHLWRQSGSYPAPADS